MRFTLSWLHDHLDTDAPLDAISHALTDIGLEVENLSDPSDALGAFQICRVLSAEPHPNADRLRVCQVETWPKGKTESPQTVQVVCGAPNARSGMIGVFAASGTHIPGTQVDLKSGVIRGVDSCGMLCSERELMLSDEHDGIIDLPNDAPIGTRFIDYLGQNDAVIDIAVTPNRPDALGVHSIARDLAARGLGTLKPIAVFAPQVITDAAQAHARIDRAAQDACALFGTRFIRNVTNRSSPLWLQNRLRAIGLRPISALVDITNFITFDNNRPLHVFDADKIKGALTLHLAQGGEQFTALDDKTYTLDAGMLVISDDNGIQSLAGVIGGLATACTASTKNVLLEAAYFDPICIAKTGRALKINSDARYRFERGIDPTSAIWGLERGSRLIVDLCGGTFEPIHQAGHEPAWQRCYPFDAGACERIVGLSVAHPEQKRILTALGFAFNADDTQVSVPSWRPDIKGPIDLVEEIARIASLGHLPTVPLPPCQPTTIGKHTHQAHTEQQTRFENARTAAATLGYHECITYSFIGAEHAHAFAARGADPVVCLVNPIARDLSHMRPSLLPGLLSAIKTNQNRGFFDLALFEGGATFHGVSETSVLTGVLCGHTHAKDIHNTRRAVDIYDVKADALFLLAALGASPAMLDKIQINPLVSMANAAIWHPGHSGQIGLGPKRTLAVFGEIHPRIVAQFDLKGRVFGFTLYPATIPSAAKKTTARAAFTGYDLHPIERDFAFILDSQVAAKELISAVLSANKTTLCRARVFDAFSGADAEQQFGKGKKSLAITVLIQPVDKAFTDADINAISQRIITKVHQSIGGILRDGA